MINIYKDFPTNWKRHSQAGLLLISENDITCRVCKNPVKTLESTQNPSGKEIFICHSCASKVTGRY